MNDFRLNVDQDSIIFVSIDDLDHILRAGVLVAVTSTISALILDDDIRVPFGKAHEHAKTIVTEGQALKLLLNAMKVD